MCFKALAFSQLSTQYLQLHKKCNNLVVKSENRSSEVQMGTVRVEKLFLTQCLSVKYHTIIVWLHPQSPATDPGTATFAAKADL